MLIRHAAIYMASNVFAAALGFTGAAVFTRLFSPDDYGTYLVATSIGGILSALLFTWVRLSVLRMEAQSAAADMRATGLACYGVSATLLFAAFPVLSLALRLPWQQALGACLFAATIALFEMQLEMLRAKQQVARYALGAAARGVSMLGLGVLFHALGFGGFGLSLSIALAYLSGSALIASRVWKPPLAPLDWNIARRMLAFGAPATLSGLALALHSATDRLTVTYFLGIPAGGEYGVAADFTRQLILVPAMALGSAAVPVAVRAFATGGPEAARRNLAESGTLMLALLLPAVVGLALVGHDLADLVLGERFRATAATLIPILSFVWLFQAITQNYVHLSFHMTGKSRGMVLQSLASLGANFLLVVPLTVLFGIAGAASGVLGAEAVGVVAGFWFARASFALPLDLGRVARVAAAAAVMAAAVTTVAALVQGPLPAVLGAKIGAGVIAYAGAAVLFDVAGARAKIAGWRGRRPGWKISGGSGGLRRSRAGR